MSTILLQSLPAEILATMATHLISSTKDLICFAVLTSHAITDKLASYSGLQYLSFTEHAEKTWFTLVKRLHCLRRLEFNFSLYCSFCLPADQLSEFPSRYLQVLRLNIPSSTTPFVRRATEPFDGRVVVTPAPDTHFEALHLDNMFPHLVDLTAIFGTWNPSHLGLVTDFVSHLPRHVHTLSLGKLSLTPESMGRLPPSLTSFQWRGETLVGATLMDLCPETRSSLLDFHWDVHDNAESEMSHVIQSIPPSVTSFTFSGSRWSNELCQSLPQTLQILRLPPNISTYYGDPTNAMSDMGVKALPSNLKELHMTVISSHLWTSQALNLLPRTLTKLKLFECPAPESGAMLPPFLQVLHVDRLRSARKSRPTMGVYMPQASRDQAEAEASKAAAEDTSFVGAPPGLRRFSVGGEILPTALPAFSTALTKLLLDARNFPSEVYGDLPRSLTHLELRNARNLSDAEIPHLPSGLHTLLLEYSEITEYPLTEEAFPSLPRGLKKFTVGRITLTGAFTPANTETWNWKVAREHLVPHLPSACARDFALHTNYYSKNGRGVLTSLSKLPTPASITDLELENAVHFTVDSLKTFTSLKTLRIGRECLVLWESARRQEPGWLSFAPALSSLTLDWVGNCMHWVNCLPPTITRFRCPHSSNAAVNLPGAGKKIATNFPASLTHLGLSGFHAKVHSAIKDSKAHIFELTDNFITHTQGNVIPHEITTLIVGSENAHQYDYDVSQLSSFSKRITQLPQTVTTIHLLATCKISNESLKLLPNLRNLIVSAVEIVEMPVLPQGCTEIHVPMTAIQAFKSQYAHLQQMEVKKIVVTLKRMDVPPSLLSLHFSDQQKVVTNDFIAALPRGLQHLGVQYCKNQLDNKVIRLLPPRLTSLAIDGSSIYDSSYEALPATLLQLTITNGLHSSPELFPAGLQSLTLSCPGYCSAGLNHRYLTGNFLAKLPRAIKSLNIEHKMALVSDKALAELPPGLTALQLKCPALTLACLDFLPDSVTTLKLPASIAAAHLQGFQQAQEARLAKIALKHEQQ